MVNEKSIKNYLHSHIIGRRLIVLDSVDSTNEYLKKLGGKGCENGTVVVAREQINGKGRLGRSWLCKRGDSLTFSVLLRPKMTACEVAPVTLLAGLAVCKALREYKKLDCKIKWPNDIIIGNRKLAGILTEMSTESEAVDYVVTGIGINVSQSEFPDEIADKAVSVFMETGRDTDKNELLAILLESIEAEFLRNNLELSANAIVEYTDLCATIGRNVTFQRRNICISGKAVAIAGNGELEVELPDGIKCLVNSGEVTVQGIY